MRTPTTLHGRGLLAVSIAILGALLTGCSLGGGGDDRMAAQARAFAGTWHFDGHSSGGIDGRGVIGDPATLHIADVVIGTDRSVIMRSIVDGSTVQALRLAFRHVAFTGADSWCTVDDAGNIVQIVSLDPGTAELTLSDVHVEGFSLGYLRTSSG